MKKKKDFKGFVNRWRDDFKKRIKNETKSRKQVFTYTDAVERSETIRTSFDEVMIEYLSFIDSNPLRHNDYFKFLNSYKKGKKLDDKYFRHDFDKLNEYYKKADENPDFNPFSVYAWERYVLFMMLKLRGEYQPEHDAFFGVEVIGSREYNPLTNIPSVLRGELPIKVKEYDIARANPTFIDLELNIDRKKDVYSIIDKRKFNRLINTHNSNETATIEDVRAELKPIYNGQTKDVITDVRFNNKGQMFRDLTKYEADYITKFVEANGLTDFVRLHDGVFVDAETKCDVLEFGRVVFKTKECVKPPITNNVVSFYSFGNKGDVETSAVSYKDFFIQENLIRITEDDHDKITIFKDTNNVVKPFNYQTDTIPFLSSNINEYDTAPVENKITKDNYGAIRGGYLLLNPKPLKYYSDSKETFGIAFKNGFAKYVKGNKKIELQNYKDVEGFFPPHNTQNREFKFEQTPEASVFELFLTMVSTGKDPRTIDLTDDEMETADLFFRMFGYLCHTYKNPAFNPAIILSDEGANDQHRDGGRGKTIISEAVAEVQNRKYKGGNEFEGGYRHRFADLEKAHKVYVLDDVPAGFNYDDLYTNIVGDISCERKGKPAQTIPFEEAPKFLITTNWAVRYDAQATSTNRRFMEFKLTKFFNPNNTPTNVFGHSLFNDWDADEWNRFYNFVFVCVGHYLEFGIEAPKYNKDEDNFRAYFYNDVILQEFERILEEVTELKGNDGFNVTDFLNVFKRFDNPLRFDGLFHHRNTKDLINAYIKHKNIGFEYVERERKWRVL